MAYLLHVGLLAALGFGIAMGAPSSSSSEDTTPVTLPVEHVVTITNRTAPSKPAIVIEPVSKPVEAPFGDPSDDKSAEDSDLYFEDHARTDEEDQLKHFRASSSSSEEDGAGDVADGFELVPKPAKVVEAKPVEEAPAQAPPKALEGDKVAAPLDLGELILASSKKRPQTSEPFRCFNKACNRGWPGDGEVQVVAHKRDYELKQAIVSKNTVLNYEICPYCLFSITSIKIVSKVADSNQEDTILECAGLPYRLGVTEAQLTVNNCHEYNNVCGGCSPVIFIYPSGGEKAVWLGITVTEYFSNSDMVEFYVDGELARTVNLMTMSVLTDTDGEGDY